MSRARGLQILNLGRAPSELAKLKVSPAAAILPSQDDCLVLYSPVHDGSLKFVTHITDDDGIRE